MASAPQSYVFTPRLHHWLARCRWPQDLSINTPDTWDWLTLSVAVCGLPSTSDMLCGTCPYTAALHSAGSRSGMSRPSYGGVSTSPREAGWAGVWASRGWGCGFFRWWTGSQIRRCLWRQRPHRGSSPHPHGHLSLAGHRKGKKTLHT